MAVLTFGSKTSKELVNKERNKVLRINLALAEPNKDWCPVFNYENLVKTALAKKESESSVAGLNKSLNGSALSFSDEDEKGLQKIARQFEEKYGGNGKRKRCQTYTELGAGYDENDSFIDNTEACEEGLMDEVQMKHEGYYINCERFDKDVASEQSDEDVQPKLKRTKKQTELTDDDSEATFENHPKKSRVYVENPSSSTEDVEHKKTKRHIDHERKKKTKTKRNLMGEKRNNEVNPKSVDPLVAGEPDSKRFTLKEDHKSVTEVIESVVNAVKNESSEESNSSSQTGESSSSASGGNPVVTNHNPSNQHPENSPSLPGVLPVELQGIVSGLLRNS